MYYNNLGNPKLEIEFGLKQLRLHRRVRLLLTCSRCFTTVQFKQTLIECITLCCCLNVKIHSHKAFSASIEKACKYILCTFFFTTQSVQFIRNTFIKLIAFGQTCDELL